MNFSIGQGDTVITPIKLAQMYAAIANGGTIWQPTIAKAVVSQQGKVIKTFEPIELGDISADSQTIAFLHDALQEVTLSGTSAGIFSRFPVPTAGKTGTAQGAGNLPWNDSSVFGAFSMDPKQPYTAVAYLEKSGYGSRAAAPVVKCVFTALAGKTNMATAVPADPLDLSSFAVASPQLMPNPLCLVGIGSSVRD